MRGKGPGPAPFGPRPGITPAYAGKRYSASVMDCPPRDHPRVCGEKLCPNGFRVLVPGSPPRMRGKVIAVHSCWMVLGITPAYAGKRKHKFVVWCSSWDHPRVCGEKKADREAVAMALGSPPRMRGKALHTGQNHLSPGITPAYAGKRLARIRCRRRFWDHPRVCGEKWSFGNRSGIQKGSPPRMRGKETSLWRCEMKDGITPAYAGKRL